MQLNNSVNSDLSKQQLTNENDGIKFVDWDQITADHDLEIAEEQEAERLREDAERQARIERTLANIERCSSKDGNGTEFDKAAVKKWFLDVTDQWASDVGRWHDPEDKKWLGMSFKPVLEECDDGVDEFCEAYLGGHTFFDHGLTQLVRATSWSAGVPESMCALIALFTLSSACGKGIRVSFKDGEETPINIYVMPIAESGTGKTKVGVILGKPLQTVHEERLNNFLEKIKPAADIKKKIALAKLKKLEKEYQDSESEETLNGMVKVQAEIDKLDRETLPPSVYLSDVTVQRLAQLLPLTNEQISFLTTEGGPFMLNLLGRHNDGKADESLLLNLYSLEGTSQARITRDDVTLKQPCASLCVMIQPNKWESLVENDTLREDGLLARTMVAQFHCLPQYETGKSRKIPQELLDHYNAKFRRIFNAYRLQAESSDEYKVIKVEEYGQQLMREFQNEIVDVMRKTSSIRPFVARWVENAKRLAGVLHVAQWGEKAHEKPMAWNTVDYAIKAMRFLIERQKQLLGKYMADRELEKFRAMYGASGWCVTKRDVDRARISWERVQLWAKNSGGLMVVTEVQGSSGRQPTVYVHHHKISNPAEYAGEGGSKSPKPV